MERGRVGIVPSHVPLINSLRIVIDGAVIVAVIPFTGEALWQDEHFR